MNKMYTNSFVVENRVYLYKLLFNKVHNKIIVVTPEEYAQILSFIIKKNIQELEPFVNQYNSFNIGICSLIDYILDKPLNNLKGIINMIDNYITQVKLNTFRYFIFDFHNIDKKIKKINDITLRKLIMAKSYKNFSFVDILVKSNIDKLSNMIKPKLRNTINQSDSDLDNSLKVIAYYLSKKITIIDFVRNSPDRIDTRPVIDIISQTKYIDGIMQIYDAFIIKILQNNYSNNNFGKSIIELIKIYIINQKNKLELDTEISVLINNPIELDKVLMELYTNKNDFVQRWLDNSTKPNVNKVLGEFIYKLEDYPIVSTQAGGTKLNKYKISKK